MKMFIIANNVPVILAWKCIVHKKAIFCCSSILTFCHMLIR